MTVTGTENRKHAVRVRTCAGCGRKKDKAELLRIVRTPEGTVFPDPAGCRDGRGAYLCRDHSCLEKAKKRKSLERTLKTAIPEETFEALREVMKTYGAE